MFGLPSFLPNVPQDPDPRATYSETEQRSRLRQVLTMAAGLMELPAPVVRLSSQLLDRLSDNQCRDVCARIFAIATFLETGTSPIPPDVDARAELARAGLTEIPPAPPRSVRAFLTDGG
jgi:hypothetical protein